MATPPTPTTSHLRSEQHKIAFAQAPELYAADRGFYSTDNLSACDQAEVKLTCIPQCGGKKSPEREAFDKSAAFKQGQRFRAGLHS